MNIGITAQGPDLDSLFEPHFARAPFFIFYDSRTGHAEAIRNGYIVHDTKIGQNVVKLLVSHDIHAVITGKAGENAQKLLKSSGIALHIRNEGGSVRDAITSMMENRLEASERRAGMARSKKHL